MAISRHRSRNFAGEAALYLLLVGILVCLFPLALYLLFLAWLHQRPHPTLVRGRWDFVGVLVALSGFLLVGGPAVLTALQTAAMRFRFRDGSFAELRDLWTETGTGWRLAWLFYFLAVVAGSAALIAMRGAVTAVYHASPALVRESLSRALAALGWSWNERGDRFAVSTGEGRKAALAVEASPSMRYASLSWEYGDDGLRRELESELARQFARADLPSGGVSGWFVTAAGILIAAMFAAVALFILFVLVRGG
jgi:hypothetical protein